MEKIKEKFKNLIWGSAAIAVAVYVVFMLILNFVFKTTGMIIKYEILWGILILLSVLIVRNTLLREDESYDPEAVLMTIVGSAVVALVVLGIISFITGPAFNSEAYTHLIEYKTTDFKEVESFNVNMVQTLDKDAAQSLGDRTFGTIGAENISQYAVDTTYTQQVYKGKLVRVTPAIYSGLGPAISGEGTPGYIIVDVVTGKSQFVKTEKPMKYVSNGFLGKNVVRVINKSGILMQWSSNTLRFEIDEEGTPYYIASIYKFKGLDSQKTLTGLVTVNAITGELSKYSVNEAPDWIDNVWTANDVLFNLQKKGAYTNGWFNSLFAKKGVLSTTDDYSYLNMNNTLYVYTGITSVSNDESNVGFVYTNLHTQETLYVDAVGAEEYSAKDAAEGAVQEKGYTAVFPTMVNVEGRPTYFLSLKDKTGLIKAYAFIDYADYTKVKVSESEKGVENALNTYRNMLNGGLQSTAETESKEITIASITGYAVNGNTIFYIEDVTGQRYMAAIEISNNLPFLREGDVVKVSATNDVVATITNIE